MIRTNLKLCCTLSATTVVAAGLIAGTAFGGGSQSAVDSNVVGKQTDGVRPAVQKIPVDRLQRMTQGDAKKVEAGMRRLTSQSLRDLGMDNLPQLRTTPQGPLATNLQTQPDRRRSENNSSRGAFLSNPTGQTYSIASTAAARFGPVLFAILNYADPSSGDGNPGGLDDIHTIGAPNPEAGRGYDDLTQAAPEPYYDHAICTESITAYNGGAGTATFRSLRQMSLSDGDFGSATFEENLYPGYTFDLNDPLQDVSDTIWSLGVEDLLAWEPLSRVVSANLAIRSDITDPFVALTGLEDVLDAPFHGGDVVLLPGLSTFFISEERVTLDIMANNGPYTDPPCPYDIVPNDGSGAYAGRIGNGAVSISDITPVLSAFNSHVPNPFNPPPRRITDVTPAGGDWKQTIADILPVLSAFNVVCPVYSNNNCVGARAATVITDGTTEFSNVNATTDGVDHGTGNGNLCDFFGSGDIVRDLWFEYELTCTVRSVIQVDTLGSTWDTKVAIYDATSGCPVDDSNLLACNDDSPFNPFTWRSVAIAENVEPGTTVLIRVGASPVAVGGEGNTLPPPPLPGNPLDGYNGTTGYEGFLTVACFPQDNDDCIDALELVIDGPVVRFDNAGATNENPSPPSTCGTDGLSSNDGGPQAANGGSRWYTLTSPTDRQITVDTDHGITTNGGALYPESFYPVEIHVYCRGCATPICVASQSNSNGPNGGTVLTFCAEGGREYLVAIWGGEPTVDADPDCCAKYDLAIDSAAPAGCVPALCGPANDECTGAIDRTADINGAAFAADTTLAGPETGTDDPDLPAGSPGCHWNGNPDAPHNTLWYEATLPAIAAGQTWNFGARTCGGTGTGVDTIVAIYSGACGALTEVGCGEDDCDGTLYYSLATYTRGPGPLAAETVQIMVGNTGDWGGSVPGTLSVTLANVQQTCPPTLPVNAGCPAMFAGNGNHDAVNGTRPNAGWVNGSLGLMEDLTVCQVAGKTAEGITLRMIDQTAAGTGTLSTTGTIRVRIYNLNQAGGDGTIAGLPPATAVSLFSHDFTVGAGDGQAVKSLDGTSFGLDVERWVLNVPGAGWALPQGAYGIYVSFPTQTTGNTEFWATGAGGPNDSSPSVSYVWGMNGVTPVVGPSGQHSSYCANDP